MTGRPWRWIRAAVRQQGKTVKRFIKERNSTLQSIKIYLCWSSQGSCFLRILIDMASVPFRISDLKLDFCMFFSRGS